MQECYIHLAILCLVSVHTFAQVDSVELAPTFLQDQIESYLDNLDEETDFDFNTMGEHLQHFQVNPLSINKASASELQDLLILSDLQISNLIQYRNELGDLLSIYELQSVPLFTPDIIDQLRSMVTVNEADHAKNKIWKMMLEGSNQLYLRSDRILQLKRGFRQLDGADTKYHGSRNRYYTRFTHRFENKLSYGFTAEKDPGEIFMYNGHPEYVSAHLYMRDLSAPLNTFVLGDYSISLGQGLIMHSGFGRGKGAQVTNIKRGGRSIRPYTSVDETRYLRGAAIKMGYGHISTMVFASHRKRDGNKRTSDEDGEYISSLQTSGFHRTASELEDKNVLNHTLFGGSVAYENEDFQISLNVLKNNFQLPFLRNPRPYNQNYFRGKDLFNTSVDYSFVKSNINFFGETAYSDNGGWATSHGALLGLNKYVGFSALYRNISPKYHALQSNAFLESTTANDEKGIYLGMEIRLNSALNISLYADHFSFSWLKFQADAPSRGQEYLARVTFFKKRKMTAYAQFRSERKPINHRDPFMSFNAISLRKRQYFRLHLNHNIHESIELRSRIELSHVSPTTTLTHKGFMIYQDVIFKSIRLPFSFTTRLAYFDIEDYAARIYAYENDLLFNFSIPAYFHQGLRFYFNVRWRMSETMILEGRWEQSRFNDLINISSGNEEIDGNLKSRIKVQFRFSF